MSGEVDPEGYWKVTADVLGPLIPTPKLTEKLLKKPPFRFVYDILMALNAQYGLLEGILDEPERDVKYFAEKEQKVSFLDKVIGLVNELLGVKLTVRSGKITAGAEVEKTNEFLQSLAKVVTSTRQVDWSRASARVRKQALATTTSNDGTTSAGSAAVAASQAQPVGVQPSKPFASKDPNRTSVSPPPPPSPPPVTSVASAAAPALAPDSSSQISSLRAGSEEITLSDLSPLQAELNEFMKQASPWLTNPTYKTELSSSLGGGGDSQALADNSEADAFFSKIDQDLYQLEKQLKGLTKTSSERLASTGTSGTDSGRETFDSEDAILQAMEQVKREAEEISALMNQGDRLVSRFTKLVTSSATVVTPVNGA